MSLRRSRSGKEIINMFKSKQMNQNLISNISIKAYDCNMLGSLCSFTGHTEQPWDNRKLIGIRLKGLKS